MADRDYDRGRTFGRDREYDRRGGRDERLAERDFGREDRGDRYGMDRDDQRGYGPFGAGLGAYEPATYGAGAGMFGAGAGMLGMAGPYGAFGTYGGPGMYDDRYGGPASDRDRGTGGGRHAGRGPRGYQRNPLHIAEEVNDRLTHHGHIDATDVEVTVHEGEVTLKGFVADRDQKRLAEDVAESVSGVRDVHNQLRIRREADRGSTSGNEPPAQRA